MSSGKRLLVVGVAGGLVLAAVVGSIWLTQADVLMKLREQAPRWSLPTPTLFPTEAPAETVLTKATPTQAVSDPTPTLQTVIRTVAPTVTPQGVCETPSGWVAYVIREGDTWESLAEASGTNVQDLLAGNCLSTAMDLTDVSLLYLPSAAAVMSSTPTSVPAVPPPAQPPAQPPATGNCQTPPSNWIQITVAPQETLWTLSRRYGTTTTALKLYNCLPNEAIQAGSRLWVPPTLVIPPTPTRAAAATATPTPAQTVPPTVTPTQTPLPSETPVPSPTLVPTETPVLVPTWTPIPWPTATPVGPTPTPPPPTSTPMPPTATSPPPTATSTPPPGNG